ncbi:MAG: hypothetical protein RH860_15670 [Cytophagales bacterium]
MKYRLTYIVYAVLAMFPLLISCSAERNNPIAKTYHNTTAHYNAYYIAREKLSDAEFKINQERQNNFNEILHVYDEMDEDMSSQLTGLAEDAIKKASLPIQYHKNSKWVDDCYILIGRARFYKRDFPNAIQTFKYVNSKSEDDNARHLALSWLLRSFIEAGELNNARAVSDYLKKQPLDKKVITEVTQARADYFQEIGELEEMAENMEVAVQFTKPKRFRARQHFILGQLYQELGNNDKAYEHYKLTLKSNPSYDLSFYSKLYLAQVTRFNSDTDIKEIKKYFEKLLKDKKNEDYKDKIYYELAKFEYKQDNINKALSYLYKSVAASEANPNQKAYSYLLLAEIHYDDLQEYETSKAYYDSTLQTLSKDHKDYESIKRRHEVLITFTKQLAIIQYEDSVQKLARMDSTELISYLNEIIEKEEERKRLEREKQENALANNELRYGDAQDGFSSGSNDQSGFYFYNASAISIGQTEFVRIWGRRALEDNWRRQNKGVAFNEEDESSEEDESLVEEEFNLKAEDFESKEEYNMAVQRLKLLKDIPFDEESMAASNKKLEEAYYTLGKIYNLNLLEYENATEAFLTLLERFPESEYNLEVMYFLYFINKDEKELSYKINDRSSKEISETYKNILLTEYPKSLYAKLILNPDYLKDAQLEDQQANALYKVAYENYQMGNYEAALQNVNSIIENYSSTTFIDKAILLRIIIKGKQKDILAYKSDLESFIEEYNTSEVLPFAKKLLNEANDYIRAATSPEENVSEATGESSEKTPYEFNAKDRHFFLFSIENKGVKTNDVMIEFSDFNKANFSIEKLKVSQLLLNTERILFSVKEFESKEDAMRYYQAFQSRGKFLKSYQNVNPEYFVIGSKNFPLFYNSKNISEYKTFFQDNYL